MRQLLKPTPEQMTEAMLDITDVGTVEIDIRADEKVIWINVDGVCVLRICRIEHCDLKGTG